MKSVCTPFCGNGFIDINEICDDYNQVSDDGCSNCQVDSGWACKYDTDRSVCTERPTAEITFISTDNTISITFSSAMTQFPLDQSQFTITITRPTGQKVTFEVGNIWWDSQTTIKLQIINAELAGSQ